MALTDSDEALTLRLSDARKLDLRVSEDVLFPILRLGSLDNQFIVKREVGIATFGVPYKVVVNTTVAIISVDQFLFEKHVFGFCSAITHQLLSFDLDFHSLAATSIVVVGQFSINSMLLDIHWSLDEISLRLLGWSLINRFEFWDDKSILVQLVSERFLCLVRCSDFLKEAWCLFFDRCKTL